MNIFIEIAVDLFISFWHIKHMLLTIEVEINLLSEAEESALASSEVMIGPLELIDIILYSYVILTGLLIAIWFMVHINKQYFESSVLARVTRIFITAQIVFGYYLFIYQRNMTIYK